MHNDRVTEFSYIQHNCISIGKMFQIGAFIGCIYSVLL